MQVRRELSIQNVNSNISIPATEKMNVLTVALRSAEEPAYVLSRVQTHRLATAHRAHATHLKHRESLNHDDASQDEDAWLLEDLKVLTHLLRDF